MYMYIHVIPIEPCNGERVVIIHVLHGDVAKVLLLSHDITHLGVRETGQVTVATGIYNGAILYTCKNIYYFWYIYYEYMYMCIILIQSFILQHILNYIFYNYGLLSLITYDGLCRLWYNITLAFVTYGAVSLWLSITYCPLICMPLLGSS